MKTRASIHVLVMLATALGGVASAAETYETIVIAPSAREAGQSDLPAEELRGAPGAQGDAGKALENLPGVARPALAGGELVVWGATPEETRVLVDGMEIPALYHLGGLRATVHTGFVRSLALVPGGYGAEFGRGLGGLVRITSREIAAEKYQGEVDVDVLDASFEAGATVGSGGGVLAAGRVGYLDRILGRTLSADTRRLFPLPHYGDFQGKAIFPLREDERVEVIFLTSSDSSAIAGNSPNPSSVASQQQDRSFTRLGIRYVRALADGSGASLLPFVGWDHTGRDQTAWLGLANEAIDSTVLGFRGDYVVPFSPWSILTL